MGLQTCRVLALDGGGIRGAYAAAVLACIEEASGKRIVDHFDLIVGTSTGGIIGIALGLEVPASTILRFYRERGPEIFPSRRRLDRFVRSVRRGFRAKHDTEPLRAALTDVLGDRLLGHSKCRLAIPAYNLVSNDVHVFKTAHDVRFREDYAERAVEVAIATAAAPTYFARAVTSRGHQLVDGGVWANCPAMVGVVEALSLGVPITGISVLSIGTLAEQRRLARIPQSAGILQYGVDTISLLLDAQARGAWAQTRHLLGERALRIDQPVAPGMYTLDDARALDELIAHGRDAGRHNVEAVIRRFLFQQAEPFTPAHSAADCALPSRRVAP